MNQLENAGIKPICVFDGQKLPAKKLTNQKRRESRANAIKMAKECLANGDPKAYSYFCQGHGSRLSKLGCVFPMVISSDFRMGEHRDDDHEEDAPYFTTLDTRQNTRLVDTIWSFLYDPVERNYNLTSYK